MVFGYSDLKAVWHAGLREDPGLAPFLLLSPVTSLGHFPSCKMGG